MNLCKRSSLVVYCFLTFLLSFFIFGCDASIGVNSEKQNANIAISYPANNSIIRDSFYVVGSLLDNSDLSSISITISNVSSQNNTNYGPYLANIDFNTKKWNVKIPSINDGSYILTATSSNDSGDLYQIKNSYTIDNTPPLIILTDPSSIGLSEPEEVGVNLSFSGMQYDDNLSGDLKFVFYNEDGSKVCDYKIINTDENWTVNIDKTDSAYISLFTLNDKLKKLETYRFAISSNDKAYLYQDSEGVEINTEGNISKYFYAWSDIVSLLQKSDETPNLSSIYSFDSGKKTSAIPSGLSQLTENGNALSDKRLSSIIEENEDVLDLASFTIDPENTQPEIDIHGFVYGYANSRINKIGTDSSLRISVKSNGNKDAINTEEMYVTLGKWDGTSVDTLGQQLYTLLPKEKVTEYVIDSELVFEYVVPSEEGQYRLIFDIKDIKGNSVRKAKFDFGVYDNFPDVSLLPGKNLVTKVFPKTDTYKVSLTAESLKSSLSLAVYEKDFDLVTESVIWKQLDIDLTDFNKVIDIDSTFVTWNLIMPVKENDECVEYKFVVFDGTNKTYLSRFFLMDFDEPQMRQLVSPQFTDGTVNVFSKDVTISGFIDEDVIAVKAGVVIEGAFKKDTVIWHDLTVDSQIQEIKSTEDDIQVNKVKSFSGIVDLDFEESIYELWICLNCSEELEEYTEPQLLGRIVWDNAKPVIIENTFGTSDEVLISVEEAEKLSFAGSVTDTNGIEGMTVVCEYIPDGGIPVITNEKINLTDTLWTYIPKFNETGKYKYTFTATDKAAKTSTLERCIYFDKALPIITMNVANSIDDKYVNGIITLEGSATDNRKIDIFSYSFVNGKDVNIARSTDLWQIKIDTNQIPDNKKLGDYLSFKLVDKAGNSADYSLINETLNKYVIKQSTDYPEIVVYPPAVIDFPNDISSIKENRNLFSTKDSFSFDVSDDDGISKVEIFITPQGKQTVKKEIPTLDLQKKYSFSFTFGELLKTNIIEGYYTVQIIAYDSELKLGSDTGIFTIAINDTELEFGEISTTISSDTYNQEEIDLGCISNSMIISGTFDDALKIKTLDVLSTVYTTEEKENQNKVVISEGLKTNRWDYYLQKTENSCSTELDFIVEDTFGRKKSMTIKYFVDNDKPRFDKIHTNFLRNVTNYVNTSEILELSGEVSDEVANIRTSGIKKLDYSFINKDLIGLDVNEYLQTSSEIEWSELLLVKNEWKLLLDMSSVEEGEYYLVFRLVDNIKNTNILYYQIVVDRAKPVIDLRVDYSDTKENGVYIVNKEFELALKVKEENLNSFIYEEIVNGELVKKSNLSYFYGEYLIIPSINPNQKGLTNYKFLITAIDMAGNKTTLQEEVLLRK